MRPSIWQAEKYLELVLYFEACVTFMQFQLPVADVPFGLPNT